MKLKFIHLWLFTIVATACVLGEPIATAVPTITPEPPLSATSRRLYEKLVEEGTLLQRMTENGVNYRDFANQFSVYEAAHTIIFEVDNNRFNRSLVLEMNKVVAGWGLAQQLWRNQIDDVDQPTEPDINGYEQILSYVPFANMPKFSIHEGSVYNGKKYIEHGTAVSIVLYTASGHFKKVRTELLKVLAIQGE
jgi:hypothetical protein